MNNQRIPDKVFENILEYSIISAVDAVIYQEGKGVLLTLRNQEPCKGKWWIQGGRQNKGETAEEAIIRKTREETGLEVIVNKFIWATDVMFDKTAFPNVKTGVHYSAKVYLVHPKDKMAGITLDSTHGKYRWIEKIEENLDGYVKTALIKSEVFKKT